MIQKFVKKIFGTRSNKEIKKLYPLVEKINQLTDSLKDKSDQELQERSAELRTELVTQRKAAKKKAIDTLSDKDEQTKFILKAEHEKLEEILPEAFAMVKETCNRMCGSSWSVASRDQTWEMIPYDVQIVGGIILHRGKVATNIFLYKIYREILFQKVAL